MGKGHELRIFRYSEERRWLESAKFQIRLRVALEHDPSLTLSKFNKKSGEWRYLAGKLRIVDFHGQAPVMWAASALLRHGEK